MDWCVVYTNVNKETIAEKNLIGQNFITYMPKYKKIISHARKISTVIKPLFPRYLFVNVDLVAQRWPIINSTYGVNVIISMEGKPVIISEDIINKIKLCEKPDENINVVPYSIMTKGDEVNILEGVFSGKKGIFNGLTDNNRVKVLFNLLGKEVTLSVSRISLAG
ncbi:MAG: transcriptional activator RfaH [Pelagibacterales bacterium]|jgi:transcriptional antiterminator RfaH|nr:transcriptional activator RfaH [Pelagibacterales bacterium]